MSKPRGDSKIASPDVTNNIKRDGPGGKVQPQRLKQPGSNQVRQSNENRFQLSDWK